VCCSFVSISQLRILVSQYAHYPYLSYNNVTLVKHYLLAVRLGPGYFDIDVLIDKANGLRLTVTCPVGEVKIFHSPLQKKKKNNQLVIDKR